MQSHEIASLQQELADLKKTNKALLVYKQQLDAILNNAPVEIYLKDREGRYLRINKEFEKIFGVKNEDLIGLLPSNVHDAELALSTRKQDLKVLQSGTVQRREETAKLVSDNKIHTLLTIKFPVFDDGGEVNGIGAVVTDITEQKFLEEQLRRVQKMDAIGQLTGGIAHDFNNILCIVMGNLELIEDHLINNEEATNRLRTAYTSAGRGAELIRKLLSVSGSRIDIPRQVSLNYFLLGMEHLISQSLTVSISTKMLLDENIWTVKIDPSELEDTIINLSLNARDAMPNGGEIVFQTSNISIGPNNLSHYPQLTEGHFVKLTVRDSGTGMTPEVCAKATEPFFTTKAIDQGTGLGLSMVQAFVYRCGGHLDIISEQGKGTEIGIFLPRATEEIQNLPPVDHSADQEFGNETILVVDDEVALVEIAVSHLQSLGYRTFTAKDSDQALGILKENPSIDLLFTDVIMPGDVDGYQLAATAQKAFPDLKVIVTSGFTNKHDDTISDAGSRKLLSFLSKPYDKASLSSEVRATLDEKANT